MEELWKARNLFGNVSSSMEIREIKEKDTLSCLFSTKILKYFIQLEI